MDHGLTRDHSKALYGLAILLMIGHHLYHCADVAGVQYVYILDKIGGGAIEQRLAWFGKICVAIYAFISGYALSRNSKSRQNTDEIIHRVCNQIFRFMQKYWIGFTAAVVLRIVVIGTTFDAKHLLKAFLLINPSAVEDGWWYAKFYVIVLLLFPLMECVFKMMLKHTCRSKVARVVGIELCAILFCWILGILGQQWIYAIVLFEGFICAQLNIFELADVWLVKCGRARILLSVFLLVVVIALRTFGVRSIGDSKVDVLLIAPFIFAFVQVFQNVRLFYRLFQWFGSHSTYMWLTHNAILYCYLRCLADPAHWSVTIYGIVLVATLALAVLLQVAEKLIDCGKTFVLCRLYTYFN